MTTSADPVSGAAIRRRRRALGLNQQTLAEALGATQTTVSRWETEESPVMYPGMLDLALEALERRQEETMTDTVIVSSTVPGADVQVEKRYTWRHECPRARQALDADAAHRVASAGGTVPDAVLALARYLIDGGGPICPNASAIGVAPDDADPDRDGAALELWYSAHDALALHGPGVDLDPRELPPAVHVRIWRATRTAPGGARGRVRLTRGALVDETHDVMLYDPLPLLAESAAPARLRLGQLVDDLCAAVRDRLREAREREAARAARREQRRTRAR